MMTPRLLWGGMTLVAAFFLVASPARSDDPAKKPDASKANAEMEAYMKAGTPGPEHKRLDSLAGSWAFTIKMWMDPNQKTPTESSGTAERRWILSGRFLQEDVHSQFMGQPFTGFGIMGYDNIQKKYTTMWIDSMTTAIGTSLGTADASGKVITFEGTHLDPLTGKPVKGRDVLRLLDNNHQNMEAFKVGPDGKEFKVMEIHFTRKAKAN